MFDISGNIYYSKYGFINKSGEIVIQPKFNDAFHFKEGLAAVQKRKKWGFIDKTGKFIIKPKFDLVPSCGFHNGLVLVVKKRKGWFVIDREGNYIWKSPR